MTIEKPFIVLREVWDWFGYGSYELTRLAVYQHRFPIRTYKMGNNIVIDREAFDGFFLLEREAALDQLLERVATTRARVHRVRKLQKDKAWFSHRNTKEYILREFPRKLDPFPPQEWNPADEFPVEFPPEPEAEVLPEPKLEDIRLEGYYAEKIPPANRGNEGSADCSLHRLSLDSDY